MSGYIPLIESLCDSSSPAGWRSFFELLVKSPEKLLGAVASSVRTADRPCLVHATELILQNAVISGLDKGFERSFPKGYVDTRGLHHALVGLFATATLATFAPQSGELPSLDKWARGVCAPQGGRADVEEETPAEYFRIARTAVCARGGGSGTVLHWLRYWLHIPPLGPEGRVPVACLVGNRGALAHLILSPVDTVGLLPEVITDLPTSLVPCKSDFLETMRRAAPADLSGSISWRINIPKGASIPVLEGDSIGGPATAALASLNAGTRWHPSALVVGRFDQEARLQPVGGEELKLDAACDSFERNYNSPDPVIAANCVQKILVSRNSAVDLGRYRDRGVSLEEVCTLDEIESSIASAVFKRTGVYEIDRSLRTLTAVPDRKEGVAGEYAPGVEFPMRMDFSHALSFSSSNRESSVCTIHYNTEASNGYIDGFADPAEENLWLKDDNYFGALANYHRHHKAFGFAFKPRPGRTYELKAQIKNGFEPGHRNLHAHILSKARHRIVELRLDLRAYLAPDYSGAERLRANNHPVLRFWRWRDPETLGPGEPQDPPCPLCEDIKALPNLRPIPESLHITPEPGVWVWEMGGVEHGGALIIDWEHLF